jgi:hypothetical protein
VYSVSFANYLTGPIFTMAIRGKYTFEMLIPKHKYDAFLMLEVIEKGSVQ